MGEKRGWGGGGERERNEWEREVLQGQRAGEIGGNCATILNISESKKGLKIRNQENRAGAENAKYGSREVSKDPHPLSPLFNGELMANSVVSTG